MTEHTDRFLVLTLLLLLALTGLSEAQFIDQFDDRSLEGWNWQSGDGKAVIDMKPGDGHGYATIHVDATRDRDNIWWALIRRNVVPALDLKQLSRSGYELRVETRIRVSHAPRRVNLHFNTQRTTDFHSHLMEYDIPDTTGWHVISMTTYGFDARPGDSVNAQMALIDWGLRKYRVNVDYFKVDVVNATKAGPDKGNPIPYHPHVPKLSTFSERVEVSQDATVDLQYPEMNFEGWHKMENEGTIPVISAGGVRTAILKWDLDSYGKSNATVDVDVSGSGILEITTHSLEKMESGTEEFGKIRVVEILNGDAGWNDETVTLLSLTGERPLEKVFNPQMIIDVDIDPKKGNNTTLITIPEPVLQRMLDGKTIGIALRPLGPIHATFYASEYASGKHAARLYFNLEGEEK